MTSGVTRITALAVIAAAFAVALSGIPAQAQPYYYNYGPQPYYGASCTTFIYGGVLYNSCPAQPYRPVTYYYPGTYYAPGPYYYPGTYFYPGTYYNFAPSRLNGTNER